MPHLPPHDIDKIQGILSKTQTDLTQVLLLMKRIGSRFEDYKNIFHGVNPWLNMLRDTARQNLEIAPALIDVVKAHGLLKASVAKSWVGEDPVLLMSAGPYSSVKCLRRQSLSEFI